MKKEEKKVNKKVKEFLLRKMTEHWMEENKGMMDDYDEICRKILMFYTMWGVEIEIRIKTKETDLTPNPEKWITAQIVIQIITGDIVVSALNTPLQAVKGVWITRMPPFDKTTS